MTRKFIAILLCVCCILLFSGCSTARYNAEDFLGRTSAEIERQYGPFDCIGMPAGEDGLYRNCQCGYTIQEARKGFLGTEPEKLFFVAFDKNGVAVRCEESYRPGG